MLFYNHGFVQMYSLIGTVFQMSQVTHVPLAYVYLSQSGFMHVDRLSCDTSNLVYRFFLHKLYFSAVNT